jgi:hypothetical protein
VITVKNIEETLFVASNRKLSESLIEGLNTPYEECTTISIKNSNRLGIFKNKIKVADDFDEWPDDITTILGVED